MLDAIVRQVVVSQKFSFCGYVDWLAGNRWTWPWTDVGMPMLKELAEEERSLELEDYKQCVRKQQILKTVRTFVRIRSCLPINCTGAKACKLRELAGIFESSYEECASISESSTWKKACMAGLFGHGTLIKHLLHLSTNFCSDNKTLLLQTAFFIGDIDSVNTIIGFFRLSEKDVLAKVPERDIVFSGSVPFIEKLFKVLPNLMEKKLGLIREACSLNRLDTLTFILEVAKPGELDELDQILDSFWKLKMFKHQEARKYYTEDKQLYHVLNVAAQHGYVPMIRFLWPRMATMPNDAEVIIKEIMTETDRDNHRSVLEFFLLQSGENYMKVTQKYVNDAFKAAVERGNVDIIELLTGKQNDGTFVSPELCLPPLRWNTLYQAIIRDRKWKGIEYLVRLKKEGDSRFADFELVDHDNTVLCMACEVGNYDLVECLLCTTDDGEFIVPRTNPAAQNNQPLVNACLGGNLQIVEKLLERDVSGDYVYKGIDPSAQDYQSIVNACSYGHGDIVEFFLEVKGGKYVLPKMNGIDITCALTAAIKWVQMESLKWLLSMKDVEEYVLPGMNGVDFTSVLLDAIYCDRMEDRMEMVRFLLEMKNGSYVLPGMNGVDFTRVLSSAIRWNRMEMVGFLLKMEDGRYVFPDMDSVDFTRVLLMAIQENQIDLVNWLLSMNEGGEYVLPGMDSVDFTLVLSSAIKYNRMEMVRFLLKMEDELYVLPGMNGVDFTRVLLGLIMLGRMNSLKWLLSMNEDGEPVLSEMNSVDFTRVLSTVIESQERGLVEWLLGMNEGGEYVVPGMNGVDLDRALVVAITCNQMEVLEFLLAVENGKYVLPGIRVTEDMLGIEGQSHEMRQFLERNLERQRINA